MLLDCNGLPINCLNAFPVFSHSFNKLDKSVLQIGPAVGIWLTDTVPALLPLWFLALYCCLFLKIIDLQNQMMRNGWLKTHCDQEEFWSLAGRNQRGSQLEKRLQDVREKSWVMIISPLYVWRMACVLRSCIRLCIISIISFDERFFFFFLHPGPLVFCK